MAQGKTDIERAKKSVSKIAAYKEVFSSPLGQVVLEDMMSTHYIQNTTFDGDSAKLIFREGERNVVLRILGLLKMDVKAIKERIKLHEEEL